MAFPSIHIEGGLIPADLIEEIASGGARGQDAAAFRLDHHARLSDEIAAAWTDARAYWHAFQRALDRLPEDDTGTSPTRQLWVIPLLYALGYEQVTFMRQAEVLDGRSYAISHRAGDDESAPPVHIEGAGTSLDQRPPSGRPRLSPHGLLQEYLNHSEHVWGVVTNGLKLRLIRDNALMTRQSYIEFDLEAMLGGEHFADFGVMYRLVHRTRLPHSTDDAPHCLLEQYFQHGVEQGGRVRERLRDGVEAALLALGNGFLAHPKSAEFVGRNHRLVAGLAEYLLATSLGAAAQDSFAASRCDAIRTRAVKQQTTLLLLRIRHLLHEAGAAVDSLAEECIVTAFQGTPGSLRWLPSEEAYRLLDEIQRPDEPTSREEAQRRLSPVVAWFENELSRDLRAIAETRADKLAEAHRRIRRVVRLGRLSVNPALPVDVLGAYVLIPMLN